ncbi:MAG: hypothetical protein KC910_33195 [Candidatus Eremiobacteraeota bacterium]|nr:hypothetical protein [Candidatus Eremiobacteraeota bacterium]
MLYSLCDSPPRGPGGCARAGGRLGPPDGERGGACELLALRYTRYRLILAQNTVDWSACLGCDDDGYEYGPFHW